MNFPQSLSKTIPNHHEKFASEWLDGNSAYLLRVLSTMPELTEGRIFLLLMYEFQNQRRVNVLSRLHSRYIKLLRERQWKEISNGL